jgi:hypothetical protein
MDEYQYQILTTNDAVNNPVGKSLFVTIPRNYATYEQTPEFFNSHINPGATAPIDTGVLHHTLGTPSTYPTAGDKDSLLEQAFTSGGSVNTALVDDYQTVLQPVCESDVADPGIALSIAVKDTDATTTTHDFSVDSSTSVMAGDWGVTIDLGFEAGYSATYSTGAETTFGGTVGCIPSADVGTGHDFAAGLFAYPFTNSFGKQYWVVNYWYVPNGQ